MTGRVFGRWMVRAALVLLAAVLSSAMILSGLLAKFAVVDSTNDSARAAKLSLTANLYQLDLSAIKKPGDSVSVPITVSSGSEVSMSYKLGLRLDGSMPLVCTLTDSSDTSVITTTIEELDDALQASELLDKSTADVLEFVPNATESQAYTLTVT